MTRPRRSGRRAVWVLLSLSLGCPGADQDTSTTKDTAPPTGAPETIRGVVLLVGNPFDDDGIDCEYTIEDSISVPCSRSECAWAFDTLGEYTFDRVDSWPADVDHEPYTGTIEYLPDYYGYPVLNWVEENGTQGILTDSFIAVTWVSAYEATLDTLPHELGGCTYRGNEPSEYCEWSGTFMLSF